MLPRTRRSRIRVHHDASRGRGEVTALTEDRTLRSPAGGRGWLWWLWRGTTVSKFERRG